MGRYRKEEKLNKLLDNFYEAQIRFNKSVKYYCVQIFCDYENRKALIHLYFHNLKSKQYMDLTLKEDDFISCKLWDKKGE